MTVCAVAPPVAAAAYLRALYAPASVRVTYAGACQGGGHASIDAWLTPAELLSDLASKGIQVSDQPTEFDSILPPDRRRHYSDPGGPPAPEALRRASSGLELIELDAGDFVIDLAQLLLTGGRRLIDVAPALGCACSGAVPGVPPHAARAHVRAAEPPRAPSPVVDHDIDLAVDVVAAPQHGELVVAESRDHRHAMPRTAPSSAEPAPTPIAARGGASDPTGDAAAAQTPLDATRRRSPTGTSRSVLGAMPQSRFSGRQLPRAYVARRRSSPKGIRQSGVRRQIDIMGPLKEERAVPRWAWLAGAGAIIAVAAAMLLRIL
jgi:hypothetical protein